MDSRSTSETPAVDSSQLFSLGLAFVPGAMHFQSADGATTYVELVRGEDEPNDPVVLRRMSGTRLCDLMGESTATLRLVSSRFVEALAAARASGWRRTPVELIDAGKGRIDGYSALRITGRAGPIQRNRTRIERREPPVAGGSPTFAEVGLIFDADSWDGSDLFMPEGTSIICLTKRVRDALVARKLSNVSLTPLSEYQLTLHREYPAHRRG